MKLDEFVIRRASAADVNELSVVSTQTFVDTYKGKGANRTDQMVLEYVREKFNETALSRELEKTEGQTWIALHKNKIIGYFRISNSGKAPADLEFSGRRLDLKTFVQLERIYVLKEFQKAGVGKLLLLKAMARAFELKSSKLWLGVWEENQSAIAFYCRQGFTKLGICRWRFEFSGQKYEDIDEVMVKELSGVMTSTL